MIWWTESTCESLAINSQNSPPQSQFKEMAPIKQALYNLIQKNEFCCLCFEPIILEEPIHVDDEVVLNTNTCENVTVSDILPLVFSKKIFELINTYNSLCKQCINSAINSYNFIQKSQQNIENLTNAVNGLMNTFECTPDNMDNSKTLFVALNIADSSSKHYYDSKRQLNTAFSALRRFHSITMKRVREENIVPRKTIFYEKSLRKGHRKVNPIKTSDMLFDKNNFSLAKCKDCLKVYPTIWNLRNHYIRVHAPKTYKCSECPRRYGSAAFLAAHKTESHCTVVCSDCGKTFYNRHTLKMHEIGHQLKLICSVCGRRYKSKETYKKHIEMNVCGRKTRANPSEAKYTCDYCKKRYTQKVSLRVHIQFEHGNYKAHICEWCGKKFWAQSRLKAHIVKHTKEKNFVCSFCGGVFVTKESLLYHTRIHTGEKPYPCPHCDSKFLSASRRADHVKRHHTGGTLECDICHSKFNSRTFLLKHKKTHDKTEGKLSSEFTSKDTPMSKVKCSEDLSDLVHFIKIDHSSWEHEGVKDAEPVPKYNNYDEADTQPREEVYLEVSADVAEDYII